MLERLNPRALLLRVAKLVADGDFTPFSAGARPDVSLRARLVRRSPTGGHVGIVSGAIL
jgi:hypothetical protein